METFRADAATHAELLDPVAEFRRGLAGSGPIGVELLEPPQAFGWLPSVDPCDGGRDGSG